MAITTGFYDIPTIDVKVDLVDENQLRVNTRKILESLRPEWQWQWVQFKDFTNGITNRIFLVTYDDGKKSTEKMVFRVYGNNTDKVIDRLREQKIIARLGKVGIAAPLHAKFQNGIVCGYLEGNTLDTKSVRDPKIVNKICETMAKLHQVELEEGENTILFDKIRQFFENIPKHFRTPEQEDSFKQYFGSFDFSNALGNLQKRIGNAKSPVVFCHNDLLVYNILFNTQKDTVHFIDYEYAGANYQLFDIANHFCEYAGVDNPDYELCPTVDEKTAFIKLYLFYFLGRQPTASEVNDCLEELPLFEATAHFFWSVWALVQAGNSTINFDFMEYAIARHNMYATIADRL